MFFTLYFPASLSYNIQILLSLLTEKNSIPLSGTNTVPLFRLSITANALFSECDTFSTKISPEEKGRYTFVFCRNKRSGEIIHEQILTNTTSPTGYLRTNIALLIGDLDIFRVKTYRYIYPLCKKFRFCREPQPYPAYDKGEEPTQWHRNTDKIKSNIIKLLDKIAA